MRREQIKISVTVQTKATLHSSTCASHIFTKATYSINNSDVREAYLAIFPIRRNSCSRVHMFFFLFFTLICQWWYSRESREGKVYLGNYTWWFWQYRQQSWIACKRIISLSSLVFHHHRLLSQRAFLIEIYRENLRCHHCVCLPSFENRYISKRKCTRRSSAAFKAVDEPDCDSRKLCLSKIIEKHSLRNKAWVAM